MLVNGNDEDDPARILATRFAEKEAKARLENERRLAEYREKETWNDAWLKVCGKLEWESPSVPWDADRIPAVKQLAAVIRQQGYEGTIVAIVERIRRWCIAVRDSRNYHSPAYTFRGNEGSEGFESFIDGIFATATVLHRALENQESIKPEEIPARLLGSSAWRDLKTEIECVPVDYPIEPQLPPTTDGRMIGLFLAIRDKHLGTVNEWPELKALLQRRFGASLAPRSLFERLQSWILREKDLDGSRADYLFLTQVIEWLKVAEISENKVSAAKAEAIESSMPQLFDVQEFIRLIRKCGQDFRDARSHRGSNARELFDRILFDANCLLSNAWEAGWLRSIDNLTIDKESQNIKSAFLASHLVGYNDVKQYKAPETSMHTWYLDAGLLKQASIYLSDDDEPPTIREAWEQRSFEILGCYAHAMEMIAEIVTREIHNPNHQQVADSHGLYGNDSPRFTAEDAYEAVVAFKQRQETESNMRSSSHANDSKSSTKARESVDPSVMQSSLNRRGRLTKEESDRLKTTMMAHLREHPTMMDQPDLLARMVGVSESTIRRWLDEFRQKWDEKTKQKSARNDDE